MFGEIDKEVNENCNILTLTRFFVVLWVMRICKEA